MTKKLPFFKFDTDSWLTGKIQLLTAAEKGIFIDLIARIWHENGTLKNDEILHRLLRVEKATLFDALQAFFSLGIMTEKDGFLCVKFIDEQIKSHNEYAEKQREFGAKGGRPKKGAKGKKKEERRKEKEDIFDVVVKTTPSVKPAKTEKSNPTEKTTETPIQSQKEPDAFGNTLHDLKCRINALFHRKDTTAWDGKEIAGIRTVAKRPGVLDEMKEIERLYNSGYPYRRRDIKTLLNNWTTEYDRARNYTGEDNQKREKDYYASGKHITNDPKHYGDVNTDDIEI